MAPVGVAAAWRDGRAPAALDEWAAQTPVAIVGVLPERLWTGTVLQALPRVMVRAYRSSETRVTLTAEADEYGRDDEDVENQAPTHAVVRPIPVASIKPSSLAVLARVLTGTEVAARGSSRGSWVRPGWVEPCPWRSPRSRRASGCGDSTAWSRRSPPTSRARVGQAFARIADYVECVFINADNSARIAFELSAVVDLVIGWKGRLADMQAIHAAATFYHSLGRGSSVEHACYMAGLGGLENTGQAELVLFSRPGHDAMGKRKRSLL